MGGRGDEEEDDEEEEGDWADEGRGWRVEGTGPLDSIALKRRALGDLAAHSRSMSRSAALKSGAKGSGAEGPEPLEFIVLGSRLMHP